MFAFNIKRNNMRIAFEKINKFHLQIISDLSYYLKNDNQLNFFWKYVENIKCKFFKVFDADSGFIMFWTAIVVLFQYMIFAISPIKIVYELDWRYNKINYYLFYIIPVIVRFF